MKTLVIGTGGREHALALALSRDPGTPEVHAAPGNPGIAAVATLHDVDPIDGTAVADLAERLAVDLVVVGPEAPLVAGVADAVTGARHRLLRSVARGRPARGVQGVRQGGHGRRRRARPPRRTSARHAAEIEAALDAFGPPYVVKDDGLAAGKGVVVTTDRGEAARPRSLVRPRGRRGVPRRAGGLAVRGLRRHHRRGRSCPRRTSSASSTAAAAPTPAAWAPTRRCRGRRPTWSRRCSPRVAAADRRRDGPARLSLRRPACTPASR